MSTVYIDTSLLVSIATNQAGSSVYKRELGEKDRLTEIDRLSKDG